MGYAIRLERAAAVPLAVVRRRAGLRELPRIVPEACGIVWGVVKAQGIEGAGRHVAVYWDDQINLEVGVELTAPLAGDFGEVVASATPAGLVATTTHLGPYNRLGEAHDALRAWLQANGHRPAGPVWEIYGHWRDEWNRDPSGITTEVFHLVAED